MDRGQGRLVSRKDLMGSDVSSNASETDSELDGEFKAALDNQLGSIEVQPEFRAGLENDDQDGNEELEFRLFASGPAKTAKIRVKSPDLSDKPPGFVVPERPSSYYFKDAPTAQEQAEIESITLSGSQVLSLSKTTQPGCALSWRLTVIKPISGKIIKQPALGHGDKNIEAGEPRTRRGKASKKVRIASRKKIQAAERNKTKQAEKEEDDRRKKAVKNRKNKLRQREKKRSEKLATTTGTEDITENEPT